MKAVALFARNRYAILSVQLPERLSGQLTDPILQVRR
jgi:hypothetical protein